MNIDEINGILAKYRHVKLIKIKWNSSATGESNGLFLTISLSINIDMHDITTLNFYEITNLNLKESGGAWYPSILDMIIRDVKHQQLEHINFYVYDYENEKISFYCRSYEIVTS